MPPHHPSIAHALGLIRRRLQQALGVRRGPVRVHVACSGGPDSVALLGLLGLLARRQQLRLSVGHVDHGLRPESGSEAEQVEQLAWAHQLPWMLSRLELRPGAGLPARARAARQSALIAQAQRLDAHWVALGHTTTDQAETLLLHLTRGAGLEGIAAMATVEPWPVEPPDTEDASSVDAPVGAWLRPLLDLTRAQTRDLTERLGLPFVDDPTNDRVEHPRVAVRKRILPSLAAWNPQVEHALARAADQARQAEDALQQWVEDLLRQRRCEPTQPADPPDRRVSRSANDPTWSLDGFARLPRAIRTRFIRRLCRAAGAPEDALSAQTVASIDAALAPVDPTLSVMTQRPRTWDLHPNLRLCAAGGRVWVARRTPASCADNH